MIGPAKDPIFLDDPVNARGLSKQYSSKFVIDNNLASPRAFDSIIGDEIRNFVLGRKMDQSAAGLDERLVSSLFQQKPDVLDDVWVTEDMDEEIGEFCKFQ